MGSLFEQLVVFLGIIAVSGTTVTTIVETLKPIVLTGLEQKYGRQYYLAFIYIIRFVLSALLVLGSGTAPFTTAAPEFFARFNEGFVFVVIVLLIVFSTEVVKPLLDKLRTTSQTTSVAVATETTTTKATVTETTPVTPSAEAGLG